MKIDETILAKLIYAARKRKGFTQSYVSKETSVNNWRELVEQIAPNAGKQALLLIDRDGELLEFSVVIGSREHQGEQIGLLGITYARPNLEGYFVTRKGEFWESLQLAAVETGSMISLSAQLFKKLLIGDISPKSLSGPISRSTWKRCSCRSWSYSSSGLEMG